MCGICGYIGADKNIGFKIAYDGIKILQNRGFDATGLVSIQNINNCAKLLCHKYVSRIDINAVELLGDHADEHQSNVIVFHTRWSTTGSAYNVNNAHPHMDNKNRVSLVHNGIIENYNELKIFLESKGYIFVSETDTEVISVLIGFYLDADYPLKDSIRLAIDKLQGTWALSIISVLEPNSMYVCRNGSPLVIGHDEHFCLVASESSAIINHVKSYFIMEDNQIIKIGLNNDKIYIEHGSKVINEPSKYFNSKSSQDELLTQIITPTPYPYKHWMLKEIFEQPKSLQRCINMGGRILNDSCVHLGGLQNNKEDLLKIKHLLIVACGTSYHAGLLGSKYFKMLQSVNSVQVIDASEFTAKDIPFPYNEVGMLVLSQSGETRDVYKAMKIAEENGIFVFSIVNSVGSLIAREAICGIYLNAGREVSVASTKSFTSQVLALALVAIWYAQENQISKQKRKQFIKCIRKLSNDVDSLLAGLYLDELVEYIWEAKDMFILGKDLGEPIAREGALKIKEVAYIHAEGYGSQELKHGPLALITDGLPIILILLDDEHSSHVEIANMEVRSRGAMTICITNKDDIDERKFSHTIRIPENKIFGSLLAIIPLQMLAYKLSLRRGNSVDLPRSLAKCVTVD
jgi:glucosamine--fructose-6-phosphate aminotransferase (isomerizing)